MGERLIRTLNTEQLSRKRATPCQACRTWALTAVAAWKRVLQIFKNRRCALGVRLQLGCLRQKSAEWLWTFGVACHYFISDFCGLLWWMLEGALSKGSRGGRSCWSHSYPGIGPSPNGAPLRRRISRGSPAGLPFLSPTPWCICRMCWSSVWTVWVIKASFNSS